MRWTDLPADHGAADTGGSGLRRAEWERLRQRLQRLPDGHPSSPDDDGPEAEAGDGDGRQVTVRGGGPETGEHGPADSGDRERDRGHERGGGSGRPGASPGPSRRRGDGRPGGDGSWLAGAGPSQPYRPWFASGEPAEPWFTAESGYSDSSGSRLNEAGSGS